MLILFFRNEYMAMVRRGGASPLFEKKRRAFWKKVARQRAALCGRQVGGERHRKQQLANAHTDPSVHICSFRVW